MEDIWELIAAEVVRQEILKDINALSRVSKLISKNTCFYLSQKYATDDSITMENKKGRLGMNIVRESFYNGRIVESFQMTIRYHTIAFIHKNRRNRQAALYFEYRARGFEHFGQFDAVRGWLSSRRYVASKIDFDLWYDIFVGNKKSSVICITFDVMSLMKHVLTSISELENKK